MEIKVSSVENVRVEVEIEERSDDEPTEGACIREESRNRLKRLGKLYAGGENAEISSPIHKTEAKFAISDNVDEDNRVNRNKPHRGLGKLADLAQNINQWEDEVTVCCLCIFLAVFAYLLLFSHGRSTNKLLRRKHGNRRLRSHLLVQRK